jgi:hypothetical protein
MFGRARLWVKDNGINFFRVLDNLSGNRLYFYFSLPRFMNQAGRVRSKFHGSLRGDPVALSARSCSG